MYSLKISLKAKKTVENYVITYRDAFLDLYTDTGLWYAETIIKEQYLIGADTLRAVLHESISKRLQADTILGYSYNEKEDIYLVTTSVGKRRVFLEYTENAKQKTRVLKDISIVRK